MRAFIHPPPPASDFELDAQIYLPSEKAVLSVWRPLLFVLPLRFFQHPGPIFAFKVFPHSYSGWKLTTMLMLSLARPDRSFF